jgi:hypothetical protein
MSKQFQKVLTKVNNKKYEKVAFQNNTDFRIGLNEKDAALLRSSSIIFFFPK